MSATTRILIGRTAKQCGLPQASVATVLKYLVAELDKCMISREKVKLAGFGVFSFAARKARPVRNPHEPDEPIVLPAHTVIKFKPASPLRRRFIETDATP